MVTPAIPHPSANDDDADPTGLRTLIARAVDGGAQARVDLLDAIEAWTAAMEFAEIIRRRDRLAAVPQSTRAATDTSPTDNPDTRTKRTA